MASKQELEWLDEYEKLEREAWRELGARREAERLASRPTCDTCGADSEAVEWCGECGNCLQHCDTEQIHGEGGA